MNSVLLKKGMALPTHFSFWHLHFSFLISHFSLLMHKPSQTGSSSPLPDKAR